MSWVKRRSPAAPSPANVPPVPMYNPNQHSKQDNQWNMPAPQAQQNTWYDPNQQKPYNYSQPTQHQMQPYWTQNFNVQPQPQQPAYTQPANQITQYRQEQAQLQNVGYQQQTQGNQQYNSQMQNVAQQTQPKTEKDSWNWEWGDEDNSNVQLQQTNSNSIMNNVADSFSNDSTWGWSVDESNSTSSSNLHQETLERSDALFPKVNQAVNKVQNVAPVPPLQAETGPVSLDRLTVGSKRGKIDNLTPQWSIESQMSQDSSDDVLHTSGSDKSHMLSRSSTVSHSSASAHDLVPENYLPPNPQSNNVTSAYNTEYSNTGVNQEVRSFDETPSPYTESVQQTWEPLNVKKEPFQELPINSEPVPPPPPKNQTPPMMGSEANSYKRVGPPGHRSVNRFRAPDARNSYSNVNYSNAFNQMNLETLPDNSEQPDFPGQNQRVRPISSNKNLNQWQENAEVTPMNDRNQYLETGQLSEFNQTVESIPQNEVSDTLPPPGLRRMVLGQMEQSESTGGANRSNDSFGEEPPPGLSRMVLGQTANSSIAASPPEPPLGLHRMIPGESSSPETTTYLQQNYQMLQPLNYASEPEMSQLTSQISPQPRSATIGADTPPAVSLPDYSPPNRSEATPVGAMTPNSTEGRMRAVGLDNPVRETHADGGNILDDAEGGNDGNRRESIEGQPEDNEISNLVTSVRDLTVGENPTDSAASTGNVPEALRRHSRQESSGSERDRRDLSPRDRKDRKYRAGKGTKGREPERYSPENYRDRKYEKPKYRDRRYEEDTDYYSDREKERRGREEYDRKYNSLRRDKERDRRRKDPGDFRRDPRRDYYYNRYEEEYDVDTRPSSRSDSVHENYKERGHDRDPYRGRDRDRDRDHRQHPRRPREPFQNYMQMYGYDPYNPYYQQYQYYENLRRTNPQAYAEWYRKYYQQAGHVGPYGTEDRASVHSGRSSANDELAKDRYVRQYYNQANLPHAGGYYRDSHSVSSQYGLDVSSYSRPFDQTDNSLNLEETISASQRLTPAKFATAHMKVSIASGNLVKILPNYPLDGQTATVELCSVQSLLANDDEYRELVRFPGPLIKGVTHKKQIIEYCEGKIRSASQNFDVVDCQSYVLMWELLILLIRQNGMVVGADIAELLMKERPQGIYRRPSSVISSVSSNVGDGGAAENSQMNLDVVHSSANSVLKEEVVTNKFRDYLIYGSGKEALEWAMKHGLWGHALFLASKLDKRTYANVMMRFANGLPMNDPLQTLYQLLSGRLPAAVTCVVDEKWGDWKPHLAMILSNTTQHPELDRKAITTLADTLLSRGSLYAAHFCYLMAQVEFGKYGSADSKLVLLGSDHTKSFAQFATNEAIHMTEIYEYACNLNDGSFVLKEFQSYKYLLATRLSDRGLLEKALAYLEHVSRVVTQNPTIAQPSLVSKVYNLADRLKYYDPSENHGAATYDDLETSRPDNSWLKDLKKLQEEQTMGVVNNENINNFTLPDEAMLPNVTQSQDPWQQPPLEQQQFQQSAVPNQQQWHAEQFTDQNQLIYQQEQSQNGLSASLHHQEQQHQQQFWPNQQQWSQNSEPTTGEQYNQQQQQQQQPQNDYWNNAQIENSPRPQISLPNQGKGRPENEDQSAAPAQKNAAPKPKPAPVQDKQATTGWFGGIWSKLALRPKNQMKLPDDKNPTIVWDPEKKKWVNLEADGADEATEMKPPPKMNDMFPKATNPPPGSDPLLHVHETDDFQNSVQFDRNVHNYNLGGRNGGVQKQENQQRAVPSSGVTSEDPGLPPKPSQPNMFKLQRNRNLKKSYVDIFNPGGKPGGASAMLPPETYSSLPTAGMQQMNFFVPQPVANANAPTDFLTPAPPIQTDDSSSQG